LVLFYAVLRLIAAGEVRAVDDQQAVLVRGKGRQDRGERERRFGAGRRVLVARGSLSDRSSGLIHREEPLERHPRCRLGLRSALVGHDLEPRQRDGDAANAPQHCSTIDLESSHG